MPGEQATAPTRRELEGRSLADLHALASELGIPRYRVLRRSDLIRAILGPGAELEEALPAQATEAETDGETREGVLDLVPDGYGFVRVEGLGRSNDDAYVSHAQVRALRLRKGDQVAGTVRRPRRSERYPSMARIETVNGCAAEELERPAFEELTAVAPGERLRLQYGSGDLALRMVDLIAPIGRGQRCLIAAPPGAGATTLLREVAQGVIAAGDVAPMVVLVDARPEEVTDWERALDTGLHASTSDRSPDAHVRLAELALERAKRLVEQGQDVVLLADSLTRLARAHGLARKDGRWRRHDEGGSDGESAEPVAVHSAKRWFASARDTQEQGSLTVVATVHVESGSDLEQLVYEALADTANMELRLDGGLARAGLFPALELSRSYTRQEESILGEAQATALGKLRRSLLSHDAAGAWERLAEGVRSTGSNEELLGAVS